MTVIDAPHATAPPSEFERRKAAVLATPEGRAAWEATGREIDQVVALLRRIDEQRIAIGLSKAELARRVGRDASAVRRVFTAGGVNPELSFVAQLADAVGLRLVAVAAEPSPGGPTADAPADDALGRPHRRADRARQRR